MIDKKVVSTIAILVACLAIVVPIIGAIWLARTQAVESETNRVLVYARDVLHRTEATATQVASGIEKLKSVRGENPCSEASLDVMRQIDLGSSYIQAIGIESNNRFICSSLGDLGSKLDLGPVELVTSAGTSIRSNVKFPFAEGHTFLTIGYDGYSAIIHKDLPIDTTTEEENVSLATYMVDNQQIVTSRGRIKPEWIDRLQLGHEVTFVDDGFVVVVLRSKTFLSGAIAALPMTYVDQRVRALFMWLIPLGLLSGGVLAFAVRYLAKLQLGMPSVIKTALKRQEFFLAYQPVVDLQSGKWVGAEALIRWQRSSGEMVRPDAFIPIAEDSGLINRITQRVMDLVSCDTYDFFRMHPDFHVAINLSSHDFHSRETMDQLKAITASGRLQAHNLIIEVTERGMMDGEMARKKIQEIREWGMSVAIDDFGTGYSSLSYLEKFKIDYLKIDKSFVDTIGTDAPTHSVVHHIIEMAKTLNLKIVAEGVETEAQANYLRERGVQLAQGWFFGKPMPLKDLAAKL